METERMQKLSGLLRAFWGVCPCLVLPSLYHSTRILCCLLDYLMTESEDFSIKGMWLLSEWEECGVVLSGSVLSHVKQFSKHRTNPVSEYLSVLGLHLVSELCDGNRDESTVVRSPQVPGIPSRPWTWELDIWTWASIGEDVASFKCTFPGLLFLWEGNTGIELFLSPATDGTAVCARDADVSAQITNVFFMFL